MKQAQKSAWPFNPNFPKAFSFPAFGSVEWWVIARWRTYNGNVAAVSDSHKCKVTVKPNWQYAWKAILADNSDVSRDLSDSLSNRNYAMKHPGGWVETLLDAQRLWLVEINGWALAMVKQEFRETNPDGLHLWHYAEMPDGTKHCEKFCRRFHAYQQARYRYHEHLLEKHCDRVLSKRVKSPQTALEARACLIGWLSRQRGNARHLMVTPFTRQKPRPERKQERFFFDKERVAPSKRRYQTRFAPSRPDEMAWLILTWPIWNCHGWQWTQVGRALVEKFRSVDAKGKPLDFWPDSMKRMLKAIKSKRGKNNSIPGEDFFALLGNSFSHPTTKEKELHDDWKWTVRSQSRVGKVFEKLCRLAIGKELEKQIKPRPRGRGTDEKPPLCDFAQQIAA